ncbi:MAG: chemotaxis protein CheW [Myxococcales bacterium]|nr:chemotaxis protein CheW [Myxococcales bacterium]
MSDDLAELVRGAQRPGAAAAAPATPTQPHVGLRSGSRWFALAAADVIEVVAVPTVTRVPAAPAHVLGVAMIRTRLVPMIDLELLLTGRPTPRLERGRAVVARAGAVELGVVALATRGLVALADGDRVDGSPAERPGWVAREVAHGDELYAVIDVAALAEQVLRGHA